MKASGSWLGSLSVHQLCVLFIFFFSFHFNHADAAATSLSSRWVLTEDFFPFFFFFISRETAGFIVTLDNIFLVYNKPRGTNPTHHMFSIEVVRPTVETGAITSLFILMILTYAIIKFWHNEFGSLKLSCHRFPQTANGSTFHEFFTHVIDLHEHCKMPFIILIRNLIFFFFLLLLFWTKFRWHSPAVIDVN